ncbi:Cation-independent mannose-6-phosphate receptor CI-MPR [Coemansia thaxteri]|uniref:Autophagy-related protein 27 n=1 Tax=Coemansia thaxteri TaxID=2663907 RepID=A0A9W8BFS8_9FUNG|nr:Cation-independent mannose-6-phosphate receptor CI-MPR [Coemansia thaxteri]
MSSLSGVPVSDVVFGNGWAPGSTRRVVVKTADDSWTISRNDSTGSITSALGVVSDGSGKVLYDLRPLARDGGYFVDGGDSGYTFTLDICRNATEHRQSDVPHITAQWQRGGAAGTLGRLDGSPRLQGNKLLIEYADGDACPGATQFNQSALISFVCDAHVDATQSQPEFVAEWAQCAFMFEWRTPFACLNSQHADDSSNDSQDGDTGKGKSASRGAVVFVVVFVVGSVYILGGFLYNRVFNLSSGLRGIEQLPNYRFWRGIYVFFRRAILLVADGVADLVDAARGRRGAIRIDAAEHSIRNEIFASAAGEGDSDNEGDSDAMPFTLR